MMKKLVKNLCLSLIAAVTFVACSNDNVNEEFRALSQLNSAEPMQVVSTDFSDETLAVMSLFDNEMRFFDYAIDETIKSVSYNLWIKQGGEWIDFGGSYGGVDFEKEMLAINIQEPSFELFMINENGHTSISYPDIGVDFSDVSMTSTGWMENPVEIVPNKEILLYSKYGTNSASLATNDQNFREVVCDVGIAVTVTFSGETIE